MSLPLPSLVARGRTELFLNFEGEVRVEVVDATTHTTLLSVSEALEGDSTFGQVVWAGKTKREITNIAYVPKSPQCEPCFTARDGKGEWFCACVLFGER